MNIKVESSKEFTMVSVEGRIDSTNAGEFEKPMMKVIDGGCTRFNPGLLRIKLYQQLRIEDFSYCSEKNVSHKRTV